MAKETKTPKRQGRKPKYDYTSEEFLARIGDLAKRGFTDREIALSLGLNETYFSEKKGDVPEISEAISRARAQVNGLVRAAFLKTAIGGRMVRQVQYVEVRCGCRGQKKDCPDCHGTGWYVPETERRVTETELAPNLAAQERWLMNYDAEWLKRAKGLLDEESMPENVKKGVNVAEWLKKEMEDKEDDTDA